MDQIELIYHQSLSNPKEKHVNDYLDLCSKIGPGKTGFSRLIDVGEQLAPAFEKNKVVSAALQGTIANLYPMLNMFEAAEEHYKKALKLYEDLAKRNPDAFNSDLAMTLNNLGALYSDLRNFEAAEEHYKKALKLYEDLAKRNPDAFNFELAEVLRDFGNLYRDTTQPEKANESYGKALLIFQEMARKSPEAFEHYLIRIKADMAKFYIESGKEKEGIECLSKCLTKRDLLPDLGARSFAALGMAQEKIQDRREAAESYLSAAATYFILLRKGVRCLDDVYENLQKAKDIGAEEDKGDIEVIIAAMKKLEGKGGRVPEGKSSERGQMLRSALEGNMIKSRSQTDNAIDEMILILIGDLSAKSNMRS